MHEKNCFITLTYDDQHLSSDKLIYRDFQLFMKKLRKTQNDPIGVFVTGEYGEENKRPHWHAILFGYRPSDAKEKYKTKRGDQVYSSEALKKAWGQGTVEFGSVTFESAGYCARYACKKIVHGEGRRVASAELHEWQPISKKSSKHAIGKKFLELYWQDIFNYGEVTLSDGRTVGSIPRYYEKWLKENKPNEWLRYVTEVKTKKVEKAALRAAEEEKKYWQYVWSRPMGSETPLTPNQVRKIITQSKFKVLQDNLKL